MYYLFKQIFLLFFSSLRSLLASCVIITGLIFILLTLILLLQSFINISLNYFNKEYYSLLLQDDVSQTEIVEIKKEILIIIPEVKITELNKDGINQSLAKSLNIEKLPSEVTTFGGALDFSADKLAAEQIARLQKLKDNHKIEAVISSKSITNELFKFLDITKKFFYFLIFFIGLGLFLTIYIVVQLLIYSYAYDINVLKKLGASNFFIVKPYLLLVLLNSVFCFAIALALNFLSFKTILIFIKSSGLNIYLGTGLNYFSIAEILLALVILIFIATLASIGACSRIIKRI